MRTANQPNWPDNEQLQQETVHLCVGLNQTTVAGKEPFFGLCSSFLTTVAAGTGRKVNVFVEEADEHFRVPADDTPALLISAGTGYAPMRSFVQGMTGLIAACLQEC